MQTDVKGWSPLAVAKRFYASCDIRKVKCVEKTEEPRPRGMRRTECGVQVNGFWVVFIPEHFDCISTNQFPISRGRFELVFILLAHMLCHTLTTYLYPKYTRRTERISIHVNLSAFRAARVRSYRKGKTWEPSAHFYLRKRFYHSHVAGRWIKERVF